MQLGIAENVAFLGLRDDIPNVLASSDIFVLSSLREGLPISAIEAMAAGRPQILTNVGGNCELIVNNEQGILVQPNDVPALAAAINHLLLNEELRLCMGQKSRERAIKHFRIEAIGKKI